MVKVLNRVCCSLGSKIEHFVFIMFLLSFAVAAALPIAVCFLDAVRTSFCMVRIEKLSISP